MKAQMTTLDFIDRAVDLYEDVTGVVAHDGTEYTYGEVNDRVNQLAHALAERGVGEGDRVALLSPNTHYFIESLYASNKLGAVFVPMNYRVTPDTYEYILNDCDADVVIADYDYAGKVEAVRDAVPRWERSRSPDWEDDWHERIEHLLEWFVVFDLATREGEGYRLRSDRGQ